MNFWLGTLGWFLFVAASIACLIVLLDAINVHTTLGLAEVEKREKLRKQREREMSRREY